jgi:hypothetical protein
MRRLDAIVADLLAGLQAMIAKRQRRRLQRLNLRRRSGAARAAKRRRGKSRD